MLQGHCHPRLRTATIWFATIAWAFCIGSGAFAQAPVDWSILGANESTIINSGQTFNNIGFTLGRTDLIGVNLTVSYAGSGVTGRQLFINDGSVSNDSWDLFNGTLSFTFSSPEEVRFEGGGSLLAGEVDSFGPGAIGSLISSHPQAGLTVTDDSVGNPTHSDLVTGMLEWVGGPGSNFTHTVIAENEQGTLYIVPEPSTLALLTLGAIGLLARRRFASSAVCK